MSIRWLRAAGFDLRDKGQDGRQFGFSIAGGRIRGHIDGVIVAGPDVGITWPALFEHKSLNAKSWADLVKRGVELSKPIYYAQLQIYMAYMDLGTALFTALNKDTQALHHEVVGFDADDRAGALRQGRRHHSRRGSGRVATAHRRKVRTSISVAGASLPSAAGVTHNDPCSLCTQKENR